MKLACALLGAAALLLPGCQSPVLHLGVALFYDAAPLGDTRVETDLRYRHLDSGADPEATPNAHKHSLDLFVPNPAAVADPEGWPLLVFVHGGGWAWGDRQYAVGRADIYGNIGRYFASQGIGTAVISYRLQPDVHWYEQVDDVGAAVAFLQREVGSRGGNPRLVFLSGHSAGAHLGMRLALDPAWLARLDIPRETICGLLPVSGAAYDLADDETYRLGASRSYFAGRFGAPPEGADPADWQRTGSVVPRVRALGPAVPPTLVAYARGESADLVRQSERLIEELEAAEAPVFPYPLPGESHYRMSLVISHAAKPLAPAMSDFIREHARACRARLAGS